MTVIERDRLIDALLDDHITEEQFAGLEALLETDPQARQAYYERLHLHTGLEITAEEAGVPPQLPSQSAASWSQFAKIAAAIAVLLCGTMIGWFVRQGPTAEQASVEPIATGFGVIADQAQANWNLSRGDLIPEGPLTLSSGTVQLDLFSGVTIIVEGNAQFEVISSMEMHVTQGNVRALVPEPAQGFRLRTNTGEVVDLGTEFAVDVRPEHADVHVLDGKVEWHPQDAVMQTLSEGESVRWSNQGQALTLPFPRNSISRIAELTSSLASKRLERRHAWETQLGQWKADPRVIAHFPMIQRPDEGRRISDQSANQRHGTIVRAQRTADRWGTADAALDFSPTGSRVRVHVPGAYQALTLHCWVKIDSLDRWYNSLFLTDGHERHEPHWQIMNDGRLFFSVKAHDREGRNNPDKQICFSPPFWSPSLSGQWLQIATTFDSGSKEVIHYLNGEVLSRETVRHEMLVNSIKIGAASIGNWSEPKRHDPDFAVRNLNGSIDEFLILSEALTPGEIAQLYEAGRP